MRDVAKHAGVSVSAVSAVINGSRYVRMTPQTRERVLDAIKATKYVPNHAARTLRLARSGVIAVIIPKISNPVFEEMLRGVQDAADELNNVVLLGDSDRVRPGSNLLDRLTTHGRVDGFLLFPSTTIDVKTIAELTERNVPVVVLAYSDAYSAATVGVDDARGFELATRHLIELGHTRIGFLGGLPDTHVSRREEGYRRALREAGIRRRPEWTQQEGFTAQGAADALTSILELTKRPTALVVNNVTTAIGVLASAHDRGIDIPGDLSIVAYHDIPLAATIRPALTCVRMPMYEVGNRGIRMLARLLDGNTLEHHIIEEPAPELIVRSSTAPI